MKQVLNTPMKLGFFPLYSRIANGWILNYTQGVPIPLSKFHDECFKRDAPVFRDVEEKAWGHNAGELSVKNSGHSVNSFAMKP